MVNATASPDSITQIKALLDREDVAPLVAALAGGEVLLLAAESATDVAAPQRAPVMLRGAMVAVVESPRAAAEVASLLTLVMHEHDVETRLSLRRREELSRFASLAERASLIRDPSEICAIVQDEAQALFPDKAVDLVLWEDSTAPICSVNQTALEAMRSDPHVVTGEPGIVVERIGVQGRSLGELRVHTNEAEGLSPDDWYLLKSLAAQVAAPVEIARHHAKLTSILEIIEEFNQYEDVDTVLDNLLFQARSIANADAGSIFLVEDGKLRFSYVHNESLFQGNEAKVAIYKNFSLDMDDSSIVGYCARIGHTVVIDDAYDMAPDAPFTFNKAFDQESGYRTTSILAVPLKSFSGNLLGVMQIINAMDQNGHVVPFDRESITYTPLFASKCAVTLERSMMTRERILRMMKLAEMRDPSETGAHVQRVGAYAAEIYQRWAQQHGVPEMEAKRYRDLIRIAAMLHDVGKVGISDTILKKPAKLDHDEFEIMKMHPIFGGQVFANAAPALDKMCYDIALHHHERWGGGGYPGHIPNVLSADSPYGAPLQGDAIPLAARITTLSDVYDALCSRRAYKHAWPEEEVLDTIRQERGRQFDPELVDGFFEIQDVIAAIRMKYQEEPH